MSRGFGALARKQKHKPKGGDFGQQTPRKIILSVWGMKQSFFPEDLEGQDHFKNTKTGFGFFIIIEPEVPQSGFGVIFSFWSGEF